MFLLIQSLASLFILQGLGQSIQPPAIPLAVRSPYLQAYLPNPSTVTSGNSFQKWPKFWTNHNLGWAGLLRVDGALYSWLGAPLLSNNISLNPATYIGCQITPSRSILSFTAGKMAINITFLSPIEPEDLVLQSFPFTYIFLEASSTDQNSHSLQVYQDISGEWLSDNVEDDIQWNTSTSNGIIYHQAQRSLLKLMTEVNNIAEDGVVYHVTNAGASATYETGQDTLVRSGFLNNSKLANVQDTFYRKIEDRWPVLALSHDLGIISSTSSPVVWGIGLVRNGDIDDTTTAGRQTRHPYFLTKYSDVPTAMSNFMNDASNALQRAIVLDSRIISDANQISPNYADLVSLASRQVVAGMEITVGSDSNGQLNKSDILIFMKDIGNSRRTNPVDILYAAFPAILFLNASWAGYLLQPLLQFESSELYKNDISAAGLGDAFPSAIGNTDPALDLAIETTGDMLIMVWAHAIFSGDKSLLSLYYPTLKRWTATLVSDQPLTPNGYLTADKLKSPNMTNLAIKGILAIRSMAEISRAVGEPDDYRYYSSTASSLVSQWQNLAGSSGHLTSTYEDSNSWGMIYNLYPDKLLGFNLVDNNTYSKQTSWYSDAASTAKPFGLPFDSNAESIAKTHWTLFTAATATDSKTRDFLVSMAHAAASNLNNYAVFPTTYNTSDGSIIGGASSPAQGAMYSLLALK
ncbi:hypothetical protein GYMLUDRAFT_250707 [Collybiopsis luxurians FD-317 M1]|uniref:Glutaminase n=1 Tax=Collybiopsis luxurians FD-317 M1 TaxID=944289 RepID=A0A0D0ARN6_9AGAR|nr:hypothetical protein GYMLUDRAFT_250707 [Collybiopsis luxurians FD-317 M1]